MCYIVLSQYTSCMHTTVTNIPYDTVSSGELTCTQASPTPRSQYASCLHHYCFNLTLLINTVTFQPLRSSLVYRQHLPQVYCIAVAVQNRKARNGPPAVKERHKRRYDAVALVCLQPVHACRRHSLITPAEPLHETSIKRGQYSSCCCY
jgi:hypothetical protein